MDVQEIVERSDWKKVLTELVIKNRLNPWDLDLELLAIKIKEKIAELDFKVSADLLLAYAIILKYRTLMISIPEYEYGQESFEIKREFVRPSRKIPISLNYLIKFIKKTIKKYKKRTTKEKAKNTQFVEQTLDLDGVIVLNEEEFNIKLEKFLNFIINKINLSEIPGDKLENFLSMLLLTNEGKIDFFQEKAFDDIIIIKVNQNG